MFGRVVGNLIVCLRSAIIGDAHTLSDFYGLDGVHTHDGLSQSSVQSTLPTCVGTESYGNATRDDLECTADRIAVFLGVFDFSNHRLTDVGKNTVNDIVVANRFKLFP